MQDLLPLADSIARQLKARNETLAICESSSGGLLSAAMLAVPGASNYFLGGAVVYTLQARNGILGITNAQMRGIRSSSEPYAALLAETVAAKVGATWGLAETGAAGPSGNRYGDAAGHTCIAVDGPQKKVLTLETGHGDRVANMRAFALKALETLAESIGGAKK
ncbi:MAG: CinA family protein [Hyphomicrobiaceae bacterium]